MLSEGPRAFSVAPVVVGRLVAPLVDALVGRPVVALGRVAVGGLLDCPGWLLAPGSARSSSLASSMISSVSSPSSVSSVSSEII